MAFFRSFFRHYSTLPSSVHFMISAWEASLNHGAYARGSSKSNSVYRDNAGRGSENGTTNRVFTKVWLQNSLQAIRVESVKPVVQIGPSSCFARVRVKAARMERGIYSRTLQRMLSGLPYFSSPLEESAPVGNFLTPLLDCSV